MSMHTDDQCQANLSMGWLVRACIAIFHEGITFFFLAVLCRPNTFWSMYPGTLWCTQMLRNAILQKKKRKNIAISIRTSTTAAKVVIFLVKLRFLFPILRAIRCPRHETGSDKKRQSFFLNDRAKLHDLALDPIHSWSTAADSCPPSDFSDRPPISISMTTGRKWLTWNRSIIHSFFGF